MKERNSFLSASDSFAFYQDKTCHPGFFLQDKRCALCYFKPLQIPMSVQEPSARRSCGAEGHAGHLERGEGIFAAPSRRRGLEGKAPDQRLPDEHPIPIPVCTANADQCTRLPLIPVGLLPRAPAEMKGKAVNSSKSFIFPLVFLHAQSCNRHPPEQRAKLENTQFRITLRNKMPALSGEGKDRKDGLADERQAGVQDTSLSP